MSDLLLMASLGLPRNGLVALYDPYRDVYGRNVLPVGAEDFETGWNVYYCYGGERTVTAGQADPIGGTGAYRVQVVGGASSTKSAVATGATPANGVTWQAGVWCKVNAGTVVVQVYYSSTGDAKQLLAVADGWQFVPLTMTFDGTKEVVLRLCTEAVGNDLDVTVYHPQLNLGPVLHAYSPPAGAPGTLQTSLDYSGHGNTLTLGASTGASTDDPAFTGTAWSFDGGDYLKVPSLGLGDITAYTVFKMNETLVGDYPGVWARGNVALDYIKASNALDLIYRDSASNSTKTIRISGLTRDKWYLAVARASASGLWSLSATGISSLAASGFTLKSDFTTYGYYLGQHYVYPAEGSIAYHAVYNWVHPDNLATRCRNAIKSLMAPRGIAL